MATLIFRLTFRSKPDLRTKRRLIAASEKFSRDLSAGLIPTRMDLGGEDLLDITPQAHKLADRLLSNVPEGDREKIKRSKIRWFAQLALRSAPFESQKLRITKLCESLDLLTYGSLAKSKPGRRAIALVHDYRSSCRSKRNAASRAIDAAIDKGDWVLFHSITEVLRSENCGPNDDKIRRIVEDALLGKTTLLVPRQLKEKYFPRLSDSQETMRNFKRWLEKWNIPHRRDERRGRASPYYGSANGVQKKI
jgi:hypothetical protein